MKFTRLKALALVAGLASMSVQAADPIKIAYLEPLSGGMANIGEEGAKNFQFVIDQLNAAGGVLGGRKFELVPIDNKLSLQETLIQLKNVIDQKIQYVVQGQGSSVDTAAGVMSGGEQQMLTLCRTLMGDPQFAMIDEPTEGLAPKIVQQVGDLLDGIAKRGIAILLVEQKLDIAMRISQRLYVMGHGKIVFEGTPAGLKQTETVRKEWLEV